MVDYIGFLGKAYDKLVKNEAFTSLVMGNVPERSVNGEEYFYIRSDITGVEFKFFVETKELKTIMVSKPESFAEPLKNVTEKEQVREKLGMPSSERGEKKVPVLGFVGAWDKYTISPANYIQVIYKVGSNEVERVDYGQLV
ncbi:hypothetical protein RND59_17905 [Vibrio ruber]|uniref:hypothetical protein n=1 Tax=Vibrio ruber TaxID=184755 RepID=UPI002892F147|nr:hypothetical protein [Vibrio ruber]WNJ97991.1 hypothetical protein RND59_17905 [Vibrio ruber]